jgi:hypothetical protein
VTTRELLAEMRFHWGDVYVFAACEEGFKATGKFGEREVLTAPDLQELLTKVRRHYPGLVAERMSI